MIQHCNKGLSPAVKISRTHTHTHTHTHNKIFYTFFNKELILFDMYMSYSWVSFW